MRYVNMRLVIAGTLAVLVCLSTAYAKKPDNPGGGDGDLGITFSVVPLDLDNPADAWDINDFREVVGSVLTESGDVPAAYWTIVESNGELVSSLTVLTGGSVAHGINNFGEIVGESYDSSGNFVAVYWPNSSSSTMELPMLSGHDNSYAGSINGDGLICGYVSKNLLDANGDPKPGSHDITSDRAVVWRVVSTNGTPVIRGPFELPSDGDNSHSAAHALNDNDEFGVAQVVGYRRSAVSGEGGAFLWEVQSHSDGTVSIVTVPDGDGLPTGINNGGFICGRLIGRHGEVDGLVWSGDTVSYLDRGKGKNQVPEAYPWDISDSGIIVGMAGTYSDSRACFWDGSDGSLVYLDQFLEEDSPLPSLMSAEAVNAFGDIVGGGWIAVPTND